MMKRLILTMWMAACAMSISAQEMAGVFTAMPDQYIPQLEGAWRKDLVDLYHTGKEARLKNTMNGFSTLKKLTPDYLLLQTTDRSTVEMKLLPLVNNTHVICMVTTVYGPVADSQIAFFTTEWTPLPLEDLLTLPTGDWFIRPDVDRSSEGYQEAVAFLDMDLVRYTLSPDASTLMVSYTTPEYLDAEARKKITPYLAADRLFLWERSHFQEQK